MSLKHRMSSAFRLPFVSLVALALFAGTAIAGVNRWTSVGPGSEAAVNALARDLSSPDTVYAATAGGGVFKSEDGGETWRAVNTGLNEGRVTALAIDPTGSGNAYAATDGEGVFKTTDGGGTWRQATNGIGSTLVTALAIDAAQSSTLYASTSESIYKTVDGAQSWTPLPGSPRPVSAIAVDSKSTVYAIGTGGIWSSDNGGQTWRALGGYQLQYTPITALAIDPTDSKTLYVAAYGHLEKTTDGGATWKVKDNGIQQGVSTLAVFPGDRKKLIAGTTNGQLYLSKDAASSWKRLDVVPGDEPWSVNVLLTDLRTSTVLVSRGPALLKGSTDSSNWRVITGGLDAAVIPTLAVDPLDPSVLVASTGRLRLARSADGGATWSRAAFDKTVLPSGFRQFAFQPGQPSTLFAAGSYLLRSEDGGRSWSSQLSIRDVRSIAFEPTSPVDVYAATGGGVLKSVDGGQHWSPTGSQSASYGVLADALNPSTVYASYASIYSYFASDSSSSHIARSTDGGNTWSNVDGGLPLTEDEHGIVLAMAPDVTSTLYAAFGERGIYKTTDGGSSWSVANVGIDRASVTAIAIDPSSPSTLYALLDDQGVFRSLDGAASWFPFNDGLGNLRVTALSIDATGRHLFASTSGGGIFGMEIRTPQSPCEEGVGSACYLGRFLVSASARHPSGNLPPLPIPIRQGDRFGSFRLKPEDSAPSDIFLKIVDGRSLPGQSFWVFHAGLTNDTYALTITDTSTGRVKVYKNGADRLGCGGIDPFAFPDAGAASVKDAQATRLSPGDGDALSLFGGRYRVTVSANDLRSGRYAPGLAMPQGDRDGYFSLPEFTSDPAFPEIFVRVGERSDGSLAFSHTGLTDLAYVLTVTDFSKGAVTTYRNDPSDPLRPCGGSVVLAQ